MDWIYGCISLGNSLKSIALLKGSRTPTREFAGCVSSVTVPGKVICHDFSGCKWLKCVHTKKRKVLELTWAQSPFRPWSNSLQRTSWFQSSCNHLLLLIPVKPGLYMMRSHLWYHEPDSCLQHHLQPEVQSLSHFLRRCCSKSFYKWRLHNSVFNSFRSNVMLFMTVQ